MTYSPETIARWEEALGPYGRAAPAADPRRSALLVIDVQEYFAGVCEPIVDTLAAAVERCRAVSVPVLFTKHGHAEPRADGGMLAEWWGDLIIEGTDGHRLIDAAGFRAGDRVVPKKRYDAFAGTPLRDYLRQAHVEDLALAGVMTNLCVETTARQAFVLDFRVRVLLDATATASEELQIASLINLAYGFAHVQRTAAWLGGLGTPRLIPGNG